MAAIPLQLDVEYPDSDGQPMAESDVHRDEMVDLIEALKRRYRDMSGVYVAGNLFLYYRKGDRSAVVAPDVFLVKGVSKRKRRSYKLWEEKQRIPSLVIEVTSETTRDEDVDRKRGIYEALGVEEYFLHDPEGDYLEPQLQGYRLLRGRYRPIPPNPDGSLDSRTTALTLRVEGDNLRLTDTATGECLLWVAEESASRQAAEQRAERETAARQRETVARHAAEERAEREAAARRALEEELARLRAEMER